MKSSTRCLLAGLFMSIASPAQAGEIIEADPWNIIHIARDFGDAEVVSDTMQDPQISGFLGDLPYEMVFHDCDLGRDCKVVLIRSTFMQDDWAETPPKPKLFGQWNQAKLFGRAMPGPQGRAILEHTVNMTGGIPEENLRDTLRRWQAAVGEFADFLGYSKR